MLSSSVLSCRVARASPPRSPELLPPGRSGASEPLGDETQGLPRGVRTGNSARNSEDAEAQRPTADAGRVRQAMAASGVKPVVRAEVRGSTDRASEKLNVRGPQVVQAVAAVDSK